MSGIDLRLRLSHKIAAIGTIGIFGLILVGGIYLVGTAAQDSHRAIASDARLISAQTSKLFVDLLEARRAEKDFLLRSDAKYAKHHGELTTAIVTDLEVLQRQTRAAGQTDIDQKVGTIRAGFASYTAHFAAVVDMRTKLGLDENSGLEGVLRASVHAIESKLGELGNLPLTAKMLMMRRHEKDFMLRRSVKYGEDMKKRLAEFSTILDASDIPASAKDDIVRKLADYSRDFFAWMAGAQTLAEEQKATSGAYAQIEPVIEAVAKAVEAVRDDAEAADARSRAATTLQMQIAILAIMLGVGGLAVLIGRAVSKPLSAMTAAMTRLASGDSGVVLPGLGRRDEVGDMAQAVETFKAKAVERARLEAGQEEARKAAAEVERKAVMGRLATSFETAVGTIVDAVSSSASELEAAASTLTHTAETTQQLAGMVAAASEQASSNVHSVASAAEELGASVGEIAHQVQHSSNISREAVRQAQATDARIGELSQAASRIGDVVKLITAIAEQTNLLALNATIEAARAGEAGRGFAVVAQEVKALAAQTAKATDEIGTQIAGMQTATRDSVAAIKEIGATIEKISEIGAAITAAVDAQGAATKDISRNVQQAAQGTTQVAANIVDVNRGAGETGSASSQVLSSARSLANEGSRLKLEVDRFLTTIRAA